MNTTLTIKLKSPLSLDCLKKSNYLKNVTKKHTRTRQVGSFRAVSWTKPDTRETVIMYENGKVVILGCKHVNHGKKVVDWILENIPNSELEQHLVQHNIVAHGQFNTEFDLHATVKKLQSKGRFAIYEPELSAPIKYHLDKGTCLIFRNGKVILTGVKTHEELNTLIKTLENDLELVMN